ncbi:MAG: hypothetical protein KA293_12170 [Bacteroidia bacterium]|nr:hypothetical protein [Bacteroidota bacterium]MBP6641037.1 hypothetical protein [Bacteroidia bacterium]
MKRFGLPMLLSAGYASLLFFIFSSDFSKEHSFLLAPKGKGVTAKQAERPTRDFETSLSARIATLQLNQDNAPSTPEASSNPDHQSPESASAPQH